MFRFICAAIVLAACAAEPSATTTTTEQPVLAGFSREHVDADIYHYTATIPVGTGPNAALRIHRVVREIAPYVPRPTAHAAMLVHGDFATFTSNFGDGLAPYLAAHGIDVWGLDRRWTLATDDISDFVAMGAAQELEDLHAALGIARTLRQSAAPVALVGFSHGAQLAYMYASVDAMRPLRDVSALVPLDFFGDYGADAADERAAACDNAAVEYQLVADGAVDSSNDFQITLGTLAQTAPDAPSPYNPNRTNRQVMLRFVGQTYVFAPITPTYHLLAPITAGGPPTGLRFTTEAAAATWLASAPPHESMLEAADLDAQLCGDGTSPVDAPLARIDVPLLYVGAAGGVGALGLHATAQVASADVSTLVIELGPDAVSDYGHGDLLYAGDAAERVWQPVAAWLAAH